MTWFRPASIVCGVCAIVVSLVGGGVDKHLDVYRFVTDMLLVGILLAVLSIRSER